MVGRGLVAVIAVALAGLGGAWVARLRHPVADPMTAPLAVSPAGGSSAQQGMPVSWDEARTSVDEEIVFDVRRLHGHEDAWSLWEALADTQLARARLLGSYADYLAAGRSLDSAFQVAEAPSGPNLLRAGYALSIHRMADVEPALQRIEASALAPDVATAAEVMGLRGDVAFYSGRYREARDLYVRSDSSRPTYRSKFRLALFDAKTGDPDGALAKLDDAATFLEGPQPQQYSFLELQRGIVALNRGDWNGALGHFRSADRFFPGFWLNEEHIALVIALKGDPARAEALFAGIARRTGSAEAIDALAGLARARGDFAASQRLAARSGAIWERRLAALPEAAYGHALDHLLAFGNPAAALRVAQANYANRPYAEPAIALAWADLANRRAADAIRVLEPVLASGWVSAELHVVASEAFALAGQGARSDAERKAALAISRHAFDRNPAMVWLEQ